MTIGHGIYSTLSKVCEAFKILAIKMAKSRKKCLNLSSYGKYTSIQQGREKILSQAVYLCTLLFSLTTSHRALKECQRNGGRQNVRAVL